MSITLLVTVTSAQNAQARGSQRDISYAISHLVGAWSTGPNTYTKWQRVQMLNFSRDNGNYRYYDTDDKMHQYPNPTLVDSTGAVQPNSWWNPFSWDWSHIMSSAWNNIFKKCLQGAAQGVVGTASGTLTVNLLTRGAKLFVGPEGYAALAIGGCIVNITF